MLQGNRKRVVLIQKADSVPCKGDPNRSLERLYDYTKFHIGVYMTLTATYLTALGLNLSGQPVLHLSGTLAAMAVVSFLTAGVSAGVIASSLTQEVDGTAQDFLAKDIGPWGAQRCKANARAWTYLEHTAFWIGILLAVLSFPTGSSCFRQTSDSVWCRALQADTQLPKSPPISIPK